jgi:hypothetical protein
MYRYHVTLFSWEVIPLCHCFAVAVATVHDIGAALRFPRTECIIQELQLFVAVEIFREQVTIDPVSVEAIWRELCFPSDPNLVNYGDNYSQIIVYRHTAVNALGYCCKQFRCSSVRRTSSARDGATGCYTSLLISKYISNLTHEASNLSKYLESDLYLTENTSFTLHRQSINAM